MVNALNGPAEFTGPLPSEGKELFESCAWLLTLNKQKSDSRNNKKLSLINGSRRKGGIDGLLLIKYD